MRLGSARREVPVGWKVLLRGAAATLAVLLAGTGVFLRDREALAFAAVVGIGLVLLWVGRQRLGTVVLGLLALNTAGWMIPGTVSNLRHGEGAVATLVPAAVALVALCVVVAAVGALVGRKRPDSGRWAAPVVGAGAEQT